MIARRSFLAGLVSSLAAPAIVRPASLMPVRLFGPYYERYLALYDIYTDSMFVRIDRARFELPVPKHEMVLPKHVALKFFPPGVLDLMQPEGRNQMNVTTAIPYDWQSVEKLTGASVAQAEVKRLARS